MKKIILFFTTITIFVFFNYSIYIKENILRHGENMFLELRPVDPRSFMQGDYMKLRFKIEEDVHFKKDEIIPLKGKLVVILDDHKIGHFEKLYTSDDLTKNQRLFNYLRDYTGINIIPDSFMFQEGHAPFYQKAKYGIFKFVGHEYLLVGLADEHLNDIKSLIVSENENKKSS